MAGDQVTYSSNSSYCYSAEAETALQEELRLLADIEARYEEERAYSDRRSRKPSRAAFPDSLRPYGTPSAVRTSSGLHNSMTSSSAENCIY